MIRRFIALFLVLLLQGKGVTGVITNEQLNAVAVVGSEAIFNCTSTTDQQHWVFARSRDAALASLGQDIAVNCAIQPGFETHYEVDRPGGSNNTCNLIVKAITVQQAGVYTCSDTATGKMSAILTVIDPIPVLKRNSTTAQEAAVEGDSVMFECRLNYNGTTEPNPTLRPYFYWTNSTGENVTSYSDSTTNDTAVSQLTVTAQRENNMTAYTCHVYFILNPPNTQDYASNTPTVNSSATSLTIEVLYAPSTPNITSEPAVIEIKGVACGISVLTCSSEGNPTPTYRWYDSAMNILSNNSTLTLGEINRYYICEANNTIGTTYTDHNVSQDSCSSTLQCCVFPHDDTTKANRKGCDNGTACNCSEKLCKITLFCNITTYPNASYIWTRPKGITFGPTDSPVYDEVTAHGTYQCTAYFNKSSSNYSGGVDFPNGTSSINVNECHSLSAGAAAGIAIGCLVIVNVIAIGLFICYYRKVHKSEIYATSEDANSKSNKNRLNEKFHWLQKMLPCLNDTKQEAGSNILWVLLFAFLGTVTGFVTFPVWICLANKSEKKNAANTASDGNSMN